MTVTSPSTSPPSTQPSTKPSAAASRLLQDHVERFNVGVETGDFGRMVERFTDDGELVFEGIPVGPFTGRQAIADAYRDQPPDDKVAVVSATERADGTIVTRYGWLRDGGREAGEMRITRRGDRIARLVVTFDQVADYQAAGSPDASSAPDAVDALDPHVIRRDFPILSTLVHGKPLVYLDSASTSQKPEVVLDAVDGFYRQYNANVHRGIYDIGERATAAYEQARVRVARFINAPDAHEIVFTRNATEAINLVAYSWGRRNIGRGDAIVLTEMEHHANLVPWQLLVQEKDGDLEFIPITDDGILRLDVLEVLLGLKPRLVAFTHVSNTLGTINPAREIVEMAHAVGALVLIDGAQATPHVPVDVQAIGADFYAFSGHKMLGPMGSGALWARRELLEAMPPFLAGGEMIREVHLRRSEWNEIPWKFEAGTPDVAAAIGLGAAVDYLSGLGMGRVREHERDLVAYALEALPREVPEIVLYGPPAAVRGGVVPFNMPGIHPHDVAQVLDRSGVAVRAGHHCTMPLHERLDLPATARASFNVYSTHEDIDALVAGLHDVQRVFGS
jgi:cysteine desulfurase/selenocysteine lyase